MSETSGSNPKHQPAKQTMTTATSPFVTSQNVKDQSHIEAQANLQLAEQMEEDECSESQTTTTGTEMSVVEKHVVALSLTGENVETRGKEPKSRVTDSRR